MSVKYISTYIMYIYKYLYRIYTGSDLTGYFKISMQRFKRRGTVVTIRSFHKTSKDLFTLCRFVITLDQNLVSFDSTRMSLQINRLTNTFYICVPYTPTGVIRHDCFELTSKHFILIPFIKVLDKLALKLYKHFNTLPKKAGQDLKDMKYIIY